MFLMPAILEETASRKRALLLLRELAPSGLLPGMRSTGLRGMSRSAGKTSIANLQIQHDQPRSILAHYHLQTFPKTKLNGSCGARRPLLLFMQRLVL
jgi:hypothetical protein